MENFIFCAVWESSSEDDCFYVTSQVRRYIHYHRKTSDFYRVTKGIAGIDFNFIQYYFDSVEYEIDTSKLHGNFYKEKKRIVEQNNQSRLLHAI